jgi:hypothetical protein
MKPQTNQMAFVAKESPNFATYGGVVAVVAPASANSFATARRFERFQRFHGKKGASMYLRQQQQGITGKMSQGAIPLFVFAPAQIDLPSIECQPLRVPCSFGVIFWQRLPFLFILGDFFLQLVNLSAGAGLSAIETTSVEKERSANLLTVFIHSGCCQKRMHPPVCS